MSDLNCLHERVSTVEKKLDEHAGLLQQLDVTAKGYMKKLEENTELTRSIDGNTKELVELFKGAKAVRKFMLWAATICAPIYAAYEFFFKGH